ncbi:pyridoxal-phosphate dependent enzyme [Oceanihabitans sp. 2_MG-2023]|uniref:1-aminocyclopropane-1-carboxylate deaminase/D-cysteine desulfhydrase n=1 Tax=Oceanihabitans sp. 2_MG-2023 TaxID=3062661 RepID=UPI0026E13E65|nr:pyridoxal-phosphate dependent enzyme [Oceanihabitans sp. 2_MG-2023]MDO6596077.1 pyridoxal-phosphate dependent enzyme [Oceanihabitans sp. 2_MG-2023]
MGLTVKINLTSDFQVFVKNIYKNHAFVSGNKLHKLKYNIIEAKNQKKRTLLTFGGAYSNHIAAVAAAGNIFGFETIGVVRGEELKNKINGNPTLSFAKQQGMQFQFISRDEFRNKGSKLFIENLELQFGDFYLIPEGGTNKLAVKGCEEILEEGDEVYDYICCPVGTGGTISGIINASFPHQKILGFPALKGDFLQEEITKFTTKTNWELITDYHFGGYAKANEVLIRFINTFKEEHKIPLDPVYTGKMLYGIQDLIAKDFFPKQSKILIIHTGGLQGIEGMNTVLKKKNLPLIQ